MNRYLTSLATFVFSSFVDHLYLVPANMNPRKGGGVSSFVETVLWMASYCRMLAEKEELI